MIEHDIGDHLGRFFLIETKDIERYTFGVIVLHHDYEPGEILNQKDYDIKLKSDGDLAYVWLGPPIVQRLLFQGYDVAMLKHVDDDWNAGWKHE